MREDARFSKEVIKRFLLSVARKNEVLILVTRKGYWIGKTLLDTDPDFQKLRENGQLLVFSDRYALKDFEYSCLNGHSKIAIFDDTLNNGNNLFFYYALFHKRYVKGQPYDITPYVYAVSTEYFSKRNEKASIEEKVREYKRATRHLLETALASDEEIYNKTVELFGQFNAKLRYQEMFTADEIARLCIKETAWLKDAVAPLVMDLPILKDRKTKKESFISNEDFARIKQDTERWQYIETQFNQVDDPVIHSCFFELQDDFLYDKFKNVFQNFVVECVYSEQKDGVRVNFVPFAIVRSFYFKDAWNYFCALYSEDGNTYDERIINFAKESGCNPDDPDSIADLLKTNHNWGGSVFRAVIYSLSMYVGYLFKEKIRDDIGLELDLDWEIMKENNIPEFIETIKSQWENFDRRQYENRLLKCKAAAAVEPVDVLPPDSINKRIATEEEVELYVHSRLISNHYVSEERRKKFLTIETIEKELDSRFIFETKKQRRRYVTKTILMLLNSSCMGNEIVLDNTSQIIYRGFKRGENSEILLPHGMKWLYVFAYALYYYLGEEGYKRELVNVMGKVQRYFEDNFYMENLISREAFETYKNYFLQMKNIHEQIRNKKYLLDDYISGNARAGEKVFVEEAFAVIRKWV